MAGLNMQGFAKAWASLEWQLELALWRVDFNSDRLDGARARHMHARIRDELSRSEWNC